MSSQKWIDISDLRLDPQNPRITSHSSQKDLANALIKANPGQFWDLMESLLEDGYEPTENILVQAQKTKFVVREGNRRVAALKIIFGMKVNVDLPTHIAELVTRVSASWKQFQQKGAVSSVH